MRLGNTLRREAIRTPGRAHVVVLGNEKGGSGKSTTAMHLAVALLHDGAKVGTIDVDGRQGTFTRYVENRHAYARANGIALVFNSNKPILSLQGRHEFLQAIGKETNSERKSQYEAALKRYQSGR